MSECEKCPRCGAKARCRQTWSSVHGYVCDTFVINATGKVHQSHQCRIAELEAALRPFAAMAANTRGDPTAIMVLRGNKSEIFATTDMAWFCRAAEAMKGST